VSSQSNCAIAAIKMDGTLWLWGSGVNGVLGNNTITLYSSPIQTVSGGTNWRSVCLTSSLTGAIKTDGSLWIWGSSVSGALGNNNYSINAVSSPIQTISRGTNWRSVSLSSSHSAATKISEF
jgi:alpha-tubulin suppressor-like RCC1 family protein